MAAIIALTLDCEVSYGPKEIKEKPQFQKYQELLWLPLFVSLFRHHVNAKNYKSYPKYNKTNPERQGHIFEKVAGKSDTDDIFTEISNGFSSESPSFFVKEMAHKQLLSLETIGESSLGETTAIGWY